MTLTDVMGGLSLAIGASEAFFPGSISRMAKVRRVTILAVCGLFIVAGVAFHFFDPDSAMNFGGTANSKGDNNVNVAGSGNVVTVNPATKPQPAPVTFQFSIGPGNYAKDADVAGFKWMPDYTDVRMLVINPTSLTYADFDAYIATNLSIANAGVEGWGTNCKVASSSPVVSSIIIQATPQNIPPMPTEVAGGISPTYRVHCDRIIPGANHEIVLAVIAQKPVPFGGDMTDAFYKKAPDWIAARIAYDAGGTHHEESPSHCFLERCTIPPEATRH